MQTKSAASFADPSLAIFAHELREPLASILLAVQAVGETSCDDLTHREMWGVVERQGRHLARLVDRVMELGRKSGGKLLLSKGWHDLSATVVNAVEAVKPLLARRQHRLTVSLPPVPAFVLIDDLRMQQVVINLLANAAKYTECGGQIHLSLESAGGLLMIEVRDNGTGISPELLPHVFDLYRQGAKMAGSEPSGLGIGLALVRSLVEGHGGNITANSGGPGTDSSFVVLLPSAEPETRQRQVGVAEPQGSRYAEPAWAASARMDA